MVLNWLKRLGSKDADRVKATAPQKKTGKALVPPEAQGVAAAPVEETDPVLRQANRVIHAASLDAARTELTQVSDVQALTAIALQRADLRDETLALPLLQTEPALGALEKVSRERNKRVNRHARNLLDEIKQQRRIAAECCTRAAELNVALTKQNAAELPMAQRATVLSTLSDEYSGQADRYNDAVQILSKHQVSCADFPAMTTVDIPSAADIEAANRRPEPEPEAEQTLEAPPVVPLPQDAILTEFSELISSLSRDQNSAELSNHDIADALTQAGTLEERWRVANADSDTDSDTQNTTAPAGEMSMHQAALAELDAARQRLDALEPPGPFAPLPAQNPTPNTLETFVRGVTALKSARQSLSADLRTLAWPKWARQVRALAALRQVHNQLNQQWSTARQQTNALLQPLGEQLDALEASLDAGQAQASKKHISTARQLRNGIELTDTLERTISGRFSHLSARFDELRDWQQFATSPKRQELCDAMDALIQQTLPPQERADEIKRLRAQWNELGPVSQSADHKLAQRFNEAAEKAFEPCRAYFAELAQEREHNSAEREKICEQLEAYLGQSTITNSEIKGAEQILRTARTAWRGYFPPQEKRLRLSNNASKGYRINCTPKFEPCGTPTRLLNKP